MEATINRKRTALLLRTDLVEALQERAEKEKRSLSNLIEDALLSIFEYEPNEETKEAIEEVRAGRYAGTIDATSFESFMKSINDIE
ncbi:MAG: ribbon-helix-helix protein, CopG family [Prevotellaceae bacterium]|nr:ribbon-helix-helix protein, CopG family [Prevotellaceae bacterium]MCD8304568.1 ribbon-helix-helix protein, CopG family [Prevotellaceae bacterium]